MANLLESLNKLQTQRATQPVGQAMNLRQMLAAKSGKAGAATGPAISTVQQNQALADVSNAATQQQQQGQLDVAAQTQQQQAQEQQFVQQNQALGQQQDQAINKFEQMVQAAEADTQRFKDNLDSERGKAHLNQLVFNRRLADEQYMAKANREGQLRRLDDQNSFEIEAMKTAFANNIELFEDQAAFNKMAEMTEAEFAKELARMDINTANQILSNQIEAANRQSTMTAVGNLGSTAIQAGTTEYTTKDSYGNKTKASLFERASGPLNQSQAQEDAWSSGFTGPVAPPK